MSAVFLTRRVTRVAVLSLVLLSGCDAPPAPPAVAKPVANYDELMQRNNCLACHQPGNQTKLPDWAEVAARYKGNKDAAALLSNKILQGGAGAWGNMDMPPYRADLSEAEAEVLAQGILATSVPAQSDTAPKK